MWRWKPLFFCPLQSAALGLGLVGLGQNTALGERLLTFVDTWSPSFLDTQVSVVVSKGFKLKFRSLPPLRFMLSNLLVFPPCCRSTAAAWITASLCGDIG